MEVYCLRTYFRPLDLFIQPIETVWTIVVGDHTGIIPTDLSQIPISVLVEDVVRKFPYLIECKIVSSGAASGTSF